MSKDVKIIRCCICNRPIVGWGNNPDGAAWTNSDGDIEFFEGSAEDRCCDECNMSYVIPGRLYRMNLNKNK